MEEPKYLYRYSYCNAEKYLKIGEPLFKIQKYEITEETPFLKRKDYYMEEYGHVSEYEVDTKEEGYHFSPLQCEGYCAEYWSFTESEEIMKWFKEQVIKSYQRNIKYYERMIEQFYKDISEIKI